MHYSVTTIHNYGMFLDIRSSSRRVVNIRLVRYKSKTGITYGLQIIRPTHTERAQSIDKSHTIKSNRDSYALTYLVPSGVRVQAARNLDEIEAYDIWYDPKKDEMAASTMQWLKTTFSPVDGKPFKKPVKENNGILRILDSNSNQVKIRL